MPIRNIGKILNFSDRPITANRDKCCQATLIILIPFPLILLTLIIESEMKKRAPHLIGKGFDHTPWALPTMLKKPDA